MPVPFGVLAHDGIDAEAAIAFLLLRQGAQVIDYNDFQGDSGGPGFSTATLVHGWGSSS